MNHPTTKELKHAIRIKYSWPGSYPLFLIMSDNEPLCINCAKQNWEQIVYAKRFGIKDSQWYVRSITINWEDKNLVCTNCGNNIEVAYYD